MCSSVYTMESTTKNIRFNPNEHLELIELSNKTDLNYSKVIKTALTLINSNDLLIERLRDNKTIMKDSDIDKIDFSAIEDKENKSLIIINDKLDVTALISSKPLTTKELDEYKQQYDIIIHGLSRIDKPQEFTEVLLMLVFNGIKQISIPSNKQELTRLFRDFNQVALSNLMLLTQLIDLKVGDRSIKSETDVLEYCASASGLTKEARNNGFRKLEASWIEKKYEENKLTENEIKGHFKGSFKELLKRSIKTEHCKNNTEILKFFRNHLKSKMATIDKIEMQELIETSIDQSFNDISNKLLIDKSVLTEFLAYDIQELIIEFEQLSRSVEINRICKYELVHELYKINVECTDCDFIAK